MPRVCFYQDMHSHDERGFIPSVVTEGEPGHAPLVGRGTMAMPWYWGKTYDEAAAQCAKENAKLGLSDEDVVEIMISSMSFGRR